MVNHSYNRQNIDVNNYQSIDMYRPTSNNNGEQSYSNNNRNNNNNIQQYVKPPSIIIEGPLDTYEPQLTNLDDPISDNNMTFNFNHQQCHNYNSNQNYGTSAGMDNGCMA